MSILDLIEFYPGVARKIFKKVTPSFGFQMVLVCKRFYRFIYSIRALKMIQINNMLCPILYLNNFFASFLQVDSKAFSLLRQIGFLDYVGHHFPNLLTEGPFIEMCFKFHFSVCFLESFCSHFDYPFSRRWISDHFKTSVLEKSIHFVKESNLYLVGWARKQFLVTSLIDNILHDANNTNPFYRSKFSENFYYLCERKCKNEYVMSLVLKKYLTLFGNYSIIYILVDTAIEYDNIVALNIIFDFLKKQPDLSRAFSVSDWIKYSQISVEVLLWLSKFQEEFNSHLSWSYIQTIEKFVYDHIHFILDNDTIYFFFKRNNWLRKEFFYGKNNHWTDALFLGKASKKVAKDFISNYFNFSSKIPTTTLPANFFVFKELVKNNYYNTTNMNDCNISNRKILLYGMKKKFWIGPNPDLISFLPEVFHPIHVCLFQHSESSCTLIISILSGLFKENNLQKFLGYLSYLFSQEKQQNLWYTYDHLFTLIKLQTNKKYTVEIFDFLYNCSETTRHKIDSLILKDQTKLKNVYLLWKKHSFNHINFTQIN